VIAALFLCYFEIIHTAVIVAILLIASALLIWQFTYLLKIPDSKYDYRKYSMLLYSYFLLVLALLIIDRISG